MEQGTQVTDIPHQARELAKRVLAQRRLLPFCLYTKQGYEPADHVVLLADALERVERGEITRLIVDMPPQHGKSEMCSVRFPLWYLGRHPDRKIAQCSYAADLAETHAMRARECFFSPEYDNVFPGVNRPNPFLKDTQSEWGPASGGRYYAVGVGGPLTGKGMNIGLIDDPFKNRAEADSETTRKAVWEWYQSTFYTRLSHDGAIIIIMTRWHEDDLVGRLLKKQKDDPDADRWTLIKMPAIDPQHGTALWPEKYPLAALNRIKANLSKYEWSALYEQEPTARGGNRFVMSGIKWHNTLDGFPEGPYVRAWDPASTKKQRDKDDPDFTAGVKMCVTRGKLDEPHIWIPHVACFRAESPERNRKIVELTTFDGPAVRVCLESFGAYYDMFCEIQQLLMGKRIVEGGEYPGDKTVKAAPMEAPFEAGNVHVYSGPWKDEFERQFMNFPNGAHDDIVDAAAIAFRKCTELTSGVIM